MSSLALIYEKDVIQKGIILDNISHTSDIDTLHIYIAAYILEWNMDTKVDNKTILANDVINILQSEGIN